MKRPVAFYMLLIMASIFLFFFLNLVLGSVSIPLRAVWNILWGTGPQKKELRRIVMFRRKCLRRGHPQADCQSRIRRHISRLSWNM